MSARRPTVADLLSHAKALGIARLDGQLLLAHFMDQPRSWLIAHDDALVDADQVGALQVAFARRAAGEPLAYLTGEKEFHGLTLRVNANVLIPRPDTELLVDWALDLLAGEMAQLSHPRVVDLGTGSGAIALSMKHRQPRAAVCGVDLSAAALDVARSNAARLDLDVPMLQGSWWDAVAGSRFDLALGNPPYIAGDDPHLQALTHEPALALTPGGDGLDALRTIIDSASDHLNPGGWLLLEHGFDQSEAVRALLHGSGFAGIESRRDLNGHVRCTGAHRAS